ncbi:MAG: FAD-dependent oxidoreductase [Rhodobacteraceae bacterium]|nr:FAD-dependent oxidoreductase [Paracoccaceae bacterium]
MAYDYKRQPYVTPPGITASEPRHPVAIIGAGPVGLAMAIDLALHGVACVVLDDNDVVSIGSRGLCWAKRTLEIYDRLGVGQRITDKGVTWQVGRQFHGEAELFNFDLLPEPGHKMPAFVNLQQYYVEDYLIDRARDFPDLIDLRFKNTVTGHQDQGDHVRLRIDTPDGPYEIDAHYLLACDGAKSPTRARMGLGFDGQSFEEQFLIADIEMHASPFGDTDVPERWFWFDPAFHPGKSALLHMQPDNIYRIDLQLAAGADPKAEAQPDRVMPRIKAMLGDKDFRLDWVSVYSFRCARLERFVHDRVIFVGDSAHVVSPFGARGGNGGIQDVDNLGWKLAAILNGDAPMALLESYDSERGHAADENILNSARATNFMTPKSPAEAEFRAETLRLARCEHFARKLLNSGRLSLPASYAGMALQTPSDAPVPPGAACPDAPLKDGDNNPVWLIDLLRGFTLLGLGNVSLPTVEGITRIGIDQTGDYPCFADPDGLASARYGCDRAYLIRPDGHVCASFTAPTRAGIAAARDRALGQHITESESAA